MVLRISFWLTAILGVALMLGSCSNQQATPENDHQHPAVPAEYAGKINPLSQDAAAVEAGSQLFATNCATCHGPEGLGDGPAAASLNPPPRALTHEIDTVLDDYLYWRIAEGGAMAPFHSVMPAWKRILTEEQIWQIISFIRSLSKS